MTSGTLGNIMLGASCTGNVRNIVVMGKAGVVSVGLRLCAPL